MTVKRISFFIIMIVLAAFSPFFLQAQSFIQSEAGVDVNLVVHGCNNNGICELGESENAINCALDCGSPMPPASTHGGGVFYNNNALIITNLSISSDQQSAVINWSSNNTALSVLSWGITSDFEIGSISDVFFITNHRESLQKLSPGTHYYFKINVRDLYGHILNYFGDFTTLSFPQLSKLPNVQDLIITYPTDGVNLTWRNPSVPDFAGVIVVRSPYAYPRDPSDGKIIYDGQGNYVTDITAQKNTSYYYTVFVYDSNNNHSSGSIAKSFWVSSTATTSPALSFLLQLSDFDFIQNGQSSIYQNSPVPVVTDKNLTVSISSDKLPSTLKFGTLQVDDPTQSHSSTYLFSFNKARDAYESQVNLFGVPGGMYPFTVQLQLATSGEATLSATFDVTKTRGLINKSDTFATFLFICWFLILFLLIILMGLVLYLIIRRFSSDKNTSQ